MYSCAYIRMLHLNRSHIMRIYFCKPWSRDRGMPFIRDWLNVAARARADRRIPTSDVTLYVGKNERSGAVESSGLEIVGGASRGAIWCVKTRDSRCSAARESCCTSMPYGPPCLDPPSYEKEPPNILPESPMLLWGERGSQARMHVWDNLSYPAYRVSRQSRAKRVARIMNVSIFSRLYSPSLKLNYSRSILLRLVEEWCCMTLQ